MRVNEATGLAKNFVREAFPDQPLDTLSLEGFTFDDHLGVWTMTIAFTRQAAAGPETRIVRISNTDRTMLSIRAP